MTGLVAFLAILASITIGPEYRYRREVRAAMTDCRCSCGTVHAEEQDMRDIAGATWVHRRFLGDRALVCYAEPVTQADAAQRLVVLQQEADQRCRDRGGANCW